MRERAAASSALAGAAAFAAGLRGAGLEWISRSGGRASAGLASARPSRANESEVKFRIRALLLVVWASRAAGCLRRARRRELPRRCGGALARATKTVENLRRDP